MRDEIVSSVMTRDVVTVRPDTGLKEIIEVLVHHGISAVPVLGATGELVGVVSEADLLPKEEFRGGVDRPRWTVWREQAAWHKSRALVASEVMTRSPVTIRETVPVSAAARRLAQVGVRRLLVVDDSGRLVGVLARRDLLAVFLRSDERIRDDILRFFDLALAVDTSGTTVDVTDGVVTLRGRLARRSVVRVCDRLIRAMPGVVGLRNELRFDVDDLKHSPAPG